MGLDIFEACAEAGLPYAVTLHDYYSYPAHKLFETKKRSIAVTKRLRELPDGTIFGSVQALETWRNAMHHYLRGAARVYVPDEMCGTKSWVNGGKMLISACLSTACTNTSAGRMKKSGMESSASLCGQYAAVQGQRRAAEMLERDLPDWLELYLFGDILDGRINETLGEN
jgi:hypothetical protein